MKTTSQKILITGAGGLLGSSLVPVLRGVGYDVVRHGISSQADVKADLTDAAQTLEMLSSVQPNAIIHLAALTNVDECQDDPQQAYLLNVKSVENICAWLSANDDDQFVHISTDQVYDGPGQHTEDDVHMSNVYGLSKYASELAVAQVDGVALRTNFFGKSRSAKRTSFTDWLFEKLTAGEDITVFEDVMFSPLSLTTLCDALVRVIETPVAGTYNLGAHDGLSKADFAFEFAKVMGLSSAHMTRGKSTDVGLRAKRPAGMLMDCTKFETTYGVSLPTLKEEIEKLKDTDYV